MDRIRMDLTPEQGRVVKDALDFYSRVLIGQLDEVANLMRHGLIPLYDRDRGQRSTPSVDQVDEIEELLERARGILGHPRGGSHGVGHPHLAPEANRAYEVKKALAKVLAEHRDPNPSFLNVDYDGIGPRYTQDPLPLVSVVDDEAPEPPAAAPPF